MDPMDDFEFKPLTEGLGFHKKKPKLTDSTPTKLSPAMSSSDLSPLSTPLPRARKNNPSQELKKLPEIEIDSNPVDEVLATLKRHSSLPSLDLSDDVAPVQWQKANPSMSAGFLDSLLIVASTLLCFIIVLAVTKVDLIGNWTNPDKEGWIYLSAFSLLMLVSFVYLSVNRVFLGRTPGEWAFDQRLGLPEELGSAGFAFKSIFRSLLIVASGFVLLPLMSFLFKEDVAGEMSRTAIYKKS